ncbi:hypothetical protein V6N12_074183 [Hibiscus sabdariffa]
MLFWARKQADERPFGAKCGLFGAVVAENPRRKTHRKSSPKSLGETHSWKTSKELEKAIQVYQNAKDRLPPRDKISFYSSTILYYLSVNNNASEYSWKQAVKRIVYRDREFRKGDELVQMIAYFYYNPKKPTWSLGLVKHPCVDLNSFAYFEHSKSTVRNMFLHHTLFSIVLILFFLKDDDICNSFEQGFYMLQGSGSLNFDASKTLMSDPKNLLKERDGYVESITRFLNLHRAGTIDELRVCFDLNLKHRRPIDTWIKIALMKKVKSLELDFEPCRSNHRRDSGNYLFGWKFFNSSEIRFLISLCLKHVDVSGQILESFLSNCPLLETLHVSHSKQLTLINVCGSSLRLKHLHISFCKCIKSIEVYAPNLVSFAYRGSERVHIDLKYVPQLCDVSYAGRWKSRWVIELHKSIHRCLATSQLVNLLLRIPFLPFVDIPSIQPDFPNLRYLTLELPNVRLSFRETVEFAKLCHLMKHMPLLQKFKLELKAVEPHIPIEEKYIQSIIKMGRELRVTPGNRKLMMLREVEIVGFVGAVVDSILVCFISLVALNLNKIVINCCLPRWHRGAPVDDRKMKEIEEGKRLVCDLLSAIRPGGSKYILL